MSVWRSVGSSKALTVMLCAVAVASMVGLSYAAVPLYRLFCQVTGYGGTTQVAQHGPATPGQRMMTVRLDANVSSGLAWDFRPVTRSIDLRVGESVLAHYRATSLSDRRTVGTATFNVTPLSAGQYFNKVECFCFTEQRLAAGESADLPVSFFIDPAIEQDHDFDGVRTITLSYTYFPAAAGGEQTSLDAAGASGQAKVN